VTAPDGISPEPAAASGRHVLRAAIWLPGLAVALGAAVATAHGLYEVALAARVPVGIAWLYPLITDGLALVAYAATARLHRRARRYAWTIVVLAAGLSGLAQAAYLAGNATLTAPPALRFGVGAWPALAAAIVAHLLYLLATDATPDPGASPDDRLAWQTESVPAALSAGPSRWPSSRPAVPSGLYQRGTVEHPVEQSAVPASNRPSHASAPDADRSMAPDCRPEQPPSPTAATSPARDRARTAAVRHAARHGDLPSVTQLADLADVSRSTAARVLKALREHGAPLHLVSGTPESRTKR
jgi:hypothetical protein